MVQIQRFKNYVSTGVAPNGRLFAGDLNLFQDLVPALSDFGQTIDAANVRVGDTSLQLTRFGPGEGRFTGSFRADGILRGLSGIIAGTYTTTQRDAIASGGAPYGIVILNTTTNQYEWNKGTDTSRQWVPLGVDPVSTLDFSGGGSHVFFAGQNAGNYPLAAKRSSDSQYRFAIREDGIIEWGPGGGSARDVTIRRVGSGLVGTDSRLYGGNGIQYGDGSVVTGATRVGGGVPSGLPHGSEWVAVNGLQGGRGWKFTYDAGIGDAYKWRFTGGPADILRDGNGYALSVGQIAVTPTYTVPYTGYFQVRAHLNSDDSNPHSMQILANGGGVSYVARAGRGAWTEAIVESILIGAGGTFQIWVQATGPNGPSSYNNPTIEVTPIRIG